MLSLVITSYFRSCFQDFVLQVIHSISSYAILMPRICGGVECHMHLFVGMYYLHVEWCGCPSFSCLSSYGCSPFMPTVEFTPFSPLVQYI